MVGVRCFSSPSISVQCFWFLIWVRAIAIEKAALDLSDLSSELEYHRRDSLPLIRLLSTTKRSLFSEKRTDFLFMMGR